MLAPHDVIASIWDKTSIMHCPLSPGMYSRLKASVDGMDRASGLSDGDINVFMARLHNIDTQPSPAAV